VRAITDATGAKVESAIYRPFGEQSEGLQPGNASPETKGWIGERYDADAGLQYLNARYYDPALGLFLQPDWFEVTQPGVGTNRFSYSFNDPVNKIDPGGNACTAMGDCGLPGEYIPGFDDFNPVAEPETTAAMAAMALAPRGNVGSARNWNGARNKGYGCSSQGDYTGTGNRRRRGYGHDCWCWRRRIDCKDRRKCVE
jgi:RHS repeat-associated protein